MEFSWQLVGSWLAGWLVEYGFLVIDCCLPSLLLSLCLLLFFAVAAVGVDVDAISGGGAGYCKVPT